MSFQEIEEPKRKSSYVAQQIIDSINNFEYEVGDRLPSERKIADQMGVSRNSVREALSALQIVEIVETKAGSGTYVKKLPDEVNISNALSMAQAGEDLLEVWEARREVEISLVKLAWMRIDDESLEVLQDILTELERAANSSHYSRYIEINARFHMKIAELAENSYLTDALKALLKVPEEHILRDLVTDYATYMKNSIQAHEDILEVIAEGPKTRIDSVVTGHFQDLQNYLKQKIVPKNDKNNTEG
ncbi:MAG: FadR/GntR family transcriptional regulator [Candidatus Bipolaricaulota bacterium]